MTTPNDETSELIVLLEGKSSYLRELQELLATKHIEAALLRPQPPSGG